MFNLMWKDILIQKKTQLLAAVYGIVFAIIFQNTQNATMVYVGVPSVIAYLFIMSACGYDDKNKSDIMLNSLPIRRKDIVMAKYMSIFLFVLIGLAMSILVTMALNLIGFLKINRLITVEDIIGCMTSVIILNSIYFPIYFKFGYLKSRYINLIVFMAIFFIPQFLSKIMLKGEPPKFILELSSQPEWLMTVGIIGTLIAIFLISMTISLKIYNNKDL